MHHRDKQKHGGRLKKVHFYPAHHDSSPFPFLQPSTLYDCKLQPSPGVTLGRQVFARLTTSKYMPPPFFPVYLPTHSLSSFICILSLSSLLFNQYLFPFPALSLSLSTSISQHLFPFLLPASFFFCLTLHLSSSESHRPKDIKGMSPPLVAVIYPGGRAGWFHTKARYPQGRIQISVETHCTLSGEESVEKVKAQIRNYVILGGMYGQMLVKCILGIV